MSTLLENLNMDHTEFAPLPEPEKPVRANITPETLAARLADILRERFQPFVSMTPQLRDTIMSFAQHFENGDTNPDWLNARLDIMTGSILAGIIDWSPYSSPMNVLMDKLWRKFRGNAATRFGTFNEQNAQAATDDYYQSLNGTVNPCNPDELQVSSHIKEVGLVRSTTFVFAGMSPDGILIRTFRNMKTGATRTQRQLLEFKCPYRHRNLVDHWPAYDLYKKEFLPHIRGGKPSTIKQPVCQYYVPQLVMGGLVMGKHRMRPLLDKCPKLAAFMEPHLEKAPSPFCGEDLIDTDHPLLFIVWASCEDVRDNIADPEVYHTDDAARSKFVRTKHGVIQHTEVAYDHAFATWMLEEVFDFWRNMYMPRMVQKELGVLLENELDVPSDLEEDE